MGTLKSKGNKPIFYPTVLNNPYILIQLFGKNLFREIEDHAIMGSNLSKQDVPPIRTLIFKI